MKMFEGIIEQSLKHKKQYTYISDFRQMITLLLRLR